MNLRLSISRKVTFLILGILVILGLDLILFVAEQSSTQSAITTYFDALFYSFTTITNFGYSDIFPATTTGRSIGFVFQILNRVVYFLIISAGIAIVRRRIVKGS